MKVKEIENFSPANSIHKTSQQTSPDKPDRKERQLSSLLLQIKEEKKSDNKEENKW